MQFVLQIPTPCHENWNEMTPTAKGSFCKSCQKEVIDFTYTSNYTLSKKLETKEKICGRFRPEQLNRPLGPVQKNPMYRAGIVLGFTSIFAPAAPAVAQVNQVPTEIVDQPFVLGRVDISQGLSEVITIKGVVKDEAGLPLPGANIVLKNSKIGSQTDFEGNFRIEVKRRQLLDNPVLVISYLGYETQEVKINKPTNTINVALTMQEDIMGEIAIVRKQNVFDKIGNLFKKKENRNCEVGEMKKSMTKRFPS